MNHSDFSHQIKEIKERLISNKSNSVWLFGYGSLLWKVDFEYSAKLFGYVNGYKRQFWLLSDDHRGTPENPGRVVTLVNHIEDKPARVYGVAYEIKLENMEKVFEYLNFREKCGYSLNEVEFHPEASDSGIINCVCYFANQTNVYYSSVQDNNLIAGQIHKSIGPSGANKEYLFKLCDALRHLADQFCSSSYLSVIEQDQHIFELEFLVKKLESD